MGWRDYQKAVNELDNTVIPDPLKGLKMEYHNILTRYWGPEKNGFTDEELQEMIVRLDELFQELTRRGCDMPVLTPEGREYLQEGNTLEDIAV